jgi:hypothetical protein
MIAVSKTQRDVIADIRTQLDRIYANANVTEWVLNQRESVYMVIHQFIRLMLLYELF